MIKIEREGVEIHIDFNNKGTCVSPLKKGDVVFFTCSVCKKESSKKVGTFRKNKQVISNNTEYLCGSCSVKKTNLKKYGVENPFQSEKIKEKIKKTNLKRYGVENVSSSPEIIKKIMANRDYKGDEVKRKKTLLKKYGVENVSQIDEVKKKKKKTCLKNYGVESPLQNEKVMEKTKKTNLKKYGVENISQIDEVKQKKQAKSIEKYAGLVVERIKKGNIEFVDEDKYTGQRCSLSNENVEYEFRCLTCGNVFVDNVHARIPRCLVCNPVQASNGEKEVFDFVVSLGFNALQGDRTIIYPLELDIVIPEKKLAIEFNGLYWHSFQSGRDSSYHLGKTISCNEKGYSLIHIFEDDWEFNKEIVKSIIKNRLGLFDRKIFARKTLVKEITSAEATDFYNINHLQGGINSSVNIGLFHNDELVSCLSFSKPRYNKKYKWEITRFANSLNVLVVGGFSRLLKHFTRNYKGSIITYSDRGMFDGSVYRNNGFKELTPSDSNYFYIKNSKRFSRVKFQKHKLENLLENFNGELTEKENMENNGYTWIYDCGNWVFEYRGE